MNCIVSYSQSNDGQAYCSPCALGTFTDVNRTINCKQCSSGTYQSQTDQSLNSNISKDSNDDNVESIIELTINSNKLNDIEFFVAI